MSLLNGAIASIFASAFSGIYLPANLYTVTLGDDGKGGGGSTPSAPIPVRVQQDAVTENMRQNAGYTARDARFLILECGVEINSDCRLDFEGVVYSLSQPERDPARSYTAVRATPYGAA